jgi:hypothetical protein
VHGIKKTTNKYHTSNEAWGEKGLSKAAVNIGTSLIGWGLRRNKKEK